MMQSLTTLAAYEAQTTAQPTQVTWVALVALIVGIVMVIAGVRRNELKKKAGLAVTGLVITVLSAWIALYSAK